MAFSLRVSENGMDFEVMKTLFRAYRETVVFLHGEKIRVLRLLRRTRFDFAFLLGGAMPRYAAVCFSILGVFSPEIPLF